MTTKDLKKCLAYNRLSIIGPNTNNNNLISKNMQDAKTEERCFISFASADIQAFYTI